ncbi:hypothetical protein [Peribacillus aracenensis]
MTFANCWAHVRASIEELIRYRYELPVYKTLINPTTIIRS